MSSPYIQWVEGVATYETIANIKRITTVVVQRMRFGGRMHISSS
jgi:hypothetical protein